MDLKLEDILKNMPPKHIEYEGYLLPRFPPLVMDVKKRMEWIRDFESRDTDIILCSFPKSGTHWVNEIISMLLAGKADYGLSQSKLNNMMESSVSELMDTMPSPRLLNTHLPFRHIPKKHVQNGYKIVHVLRNPKDCAVSFYNHSKKDISIKTDDFPGKWDEYISGFCENKFRLYVRSTAKVIYGREKLRKKEKPGLYVRSTAKVIYGREKLRKKEKSGLYVRSTAKVIYGREKLRKKEKPDLYRGWWDYEKEWEQAKEKQVTNIHTVFYEDLKMNAVPEIKKLAEFLQRPYTEELLKEIAEKCSFENLVKAANEREDSQFLKKVSADGTDFVYRKGQIGDWKNWFTVAQNEMFDAVIEREMKDSTLKFTYQN